MSERITLEQYHEAIKVIRAYEEQCHKDKLKVYEGCTKDDILKRETISILRQNKEFHFWVTKEKEIPERESDGCITFDKRCEFYTLEGGRVPYDTFEQAYKNMIKSFKKKGYIK